MKKVFGILVVAVIIAGALSYRVKNTQAPQFSDQPDTQAWSRYSNDELGIIFSYPPEWGEATGTATVTFSKNPDVVGHTIGGIAGTLVKDKCPRPKIIVDGSFCRLFTDDRGRYLYESFGATLNFNSDVIQQAMIDQFVLMQKISGPTLQSILDRTADPAILQKIDTFEQVMLTLEVK